MPAGLVVAAPSRAPQACGETGGEYLRGVGIAIRAPGGWGRSKAKPAIEVSTGFSASASACEAHREFIESSLAKGRNAMAIWQDLVDRYGFSHAYASVRRFAAKLRKGTQTEACAIIVTAPGEEALVD